MNNKINCWSKVQTSEPRPAPRVGHTALYFKKDGKVVVIGGATPESVYADVWVLDVRSLQWERLDVAGEFDARYEHSAFLPRPDEQRVWVFAGADMDHTKNDLWELSLDAREWTQVSQSGDVPPARTYHTTTALLKDKFVVFCGGKKNVEAMSGVDVFELDVPSKEWKIVPCKGEAPQPRQGHVMVAVDDKLLCHGGMAGSQLYDDLHVLHGDGTWAPVECKQRPSGRAAHGAVLHNRHLYVFGGLGEQGALNDLWRLCVDTMEWEQVVTSGTPPPCRLDFTVALVNLQEEEGSGDEARTFLLVHGGLDDTGNIFDDTYSLCLEDIAK